MDLTNVVIAIVVVLLVLSFRWFLRKFCDTLNWNSRFTSHTSDSNTTTINSSPQVRTVYTIEVNNLKTKKSNKYIIYEVIFHTLAHSIRQIRPLCPRSKWNMGEILAFLA